MASNTLSVMPTSQNSKMLVDAGVLQHFCGLSLQSVPLCQAFLQRIFEALTRLNVTGDLKQLKLRMNVKECCMELLHALRIYSMCASRAKEI